MQYAKITENVEMNMIKYVTEEAGDNSATLQAKLDEIEGKGKLITVIWREYYVVVYEYDEQDDGN
jgi:hypothetical protein